MTKKENKLAVKELKNEYSTKQIAEILGISQRTVQKYIQEDRELGDIAYKSIAKAQKAQDQNTISKKIIRESTRQYNVIEEMNNSLKDILEKHSFTKLKPKVDNNENDKVGVIQLSDIHFNEVIDDVYGNKYDFDVASARLKKFVNKAKYYFLSQGITSVALFMTGDLMNSDRRLDEITANATNRSSAVFVAVDILQQLIQDLLIDFNNVTVSSITGNESRVAQDNHWSSFLSGDSYDIVIHNMLTVLFKNQDNVKFVEVSNPMEQVVKVLNTNFLLVHGHGHGRLAGTSNLETQVQNLKANYASKGIKIDYTICGHIHQAFVSDNFSRSSGLPGANAYSTNALNLSGKASQNIYIVDEDGSIDGIKVCLQEYCLKNKYTYDESLLNRKTNINRNMIVQSVLI